MTLPRQAVLGGAVLAGLARWRWDRWPALGDVAALDLVAGEAPGLYAMLQVWHYAGPVAAGLIAGSLLLSLWEVWGPRWGGGGVLAKLPARPRAGKDDPLLVVGEEHHPERVAEIADPRWLALPMDGMATGIFVAGGVGSGKTTACMRPFAEQVLGWQAGDPERRAAALVLEVKGDFCRQVRDVLRGCGREGDYVELGLGSEWGWNPLDVPEMDSHSLASQVATLQNQLSGKSKEPYWQQASTALLRWIIEVHRLPPHGGWVTMRDLYRTAVNLERFAKMIQAASAACGVGGASGDRRISVAGGTLVELPEEAQGWAWSESEGGEHLTADWDDGREALLAAAGVEYGIDESEPGGGGSDDERERVEAVQEWYTRHWLQLDGKLRTSIVEGVASFLSLFDEPAARRAFCPARPDEAGEGRPETLPPLRELIEGGAVVCLNMPSAANPALARAAGVMLKSAWLRALLERPADMARPENEGRYWRPALFVCDEYQQFATVGEDDPQGDEKSFAMSRQARCIPLVATQSLASLESATRGSGAWKTLLQCFRTRIFLGLSDSGSARLAAEICGQVERLKPSYSVSESGGRGGVSLVGGTLSGARGGVGASKSWQPRREPRFGPERFQELDVCQAIVQPFDGRRSLPARLVYLKPSWLPKNLGYFDARRMRKL
ncbi:MAG: TraM recognition domain-containing protein [bacterium]|nr:TraM recognition domain-containing protein [bacterium]